MKTGKPAAAARVLQHWPLVLLLLPWSLGNLLTPALARADCDEAEVVLGGGEQHTFSDKVEEFERTLFVKRESSFEGISVNVYGDGIQNIAWFPAEDECFPEKDTWYELLAFVKIENKNSTLRFGFETKSCTRICERNKAPLSLQRQSVVAHGTSRWLRGFPPFGCPIARLGTMHNYNTAPTCKEPPAPLSTLTIIVITIVVFLVVVALLVAAVRVIEKKRLLWAKSYAPPESPPADQTSCAEHN